MLTNRERGSDIPMLGWSFGYQKDWLRYDVIAGLIPAAVVIPKAMAYATMAGLPVQVGLYTALVPMVIYLDQNPVDACSLAVVSFRAQFRQSMLRQHTHQNVSAVSLPPGEVGVGAAHDASR